MFCMIILLILPKLFEKTLSRSGDIESCRPGRRIYMYPLPQFMDEGLSEERRLMKWVGIFQAGIFQWGIFLEPDLIYKHFNYVVTLLSVNCKFIC